MINIEQNFINLHPQSLALSKKGKVLFPSGVTHDIRAFKPFPIYVEKADKGKKWDVDGNILIDYIGGHGSLLLGHNRFEITEAIQSALKLGTHFGSSHQNEIEWAEAVVDMVPCAETVRFTSSGTEATMMALRLSRAYTKRDAIVKLENHFHGWHDIVVGKNNNNIISSPGVPSGFYDSLTILPNGDIDALYERLNKKDVAALILEPTGAHWGAHPLDSEYLIKANEIAQQTGTMFILDEVITGFRMSPGGAQEIYGLQADLSTHAKILAGGLPGGCVTGKKEILELIETRDDKWNNQKKVSHQGTYNANPISAAAGKAALDLIKDGAEIIIADRLSKKLVKLLNQIFKKNKIMGRAWNVSSMWHLNLGYKINNLLDNIEDTRWHFDVEPQGVRNDLVLPLKWALINEGVDLFGTGGVLSSAHTDNDIEKTGVAFENAIIAMKKEGLVI
ncbi:MAG: aminotransferase class III-fold pyridoxal phosphate-dependent enzyme [Dehalococcoidia bacterium]|jgi:glutamate-1-semialdehyde 2,1-aminomutase|nr:MAG: glutamate-1-semialdehyde 2,1-aminomutase [Chloroflexota bacterium]